MATYSKVQFIAFNIKPDTKSENNCPIEGCNCTNLNADVTGTCQDCHHTHKVYLGDKEPSKDIEKRCTLMKKAIETAFHDATLFKAKVRRSKWNVFSKKKPVLKVFMAPEFYFRGSEGGYPVENISQIMETMREETRYKAYKDWLFVFGTAIGYQKHKETLSKILKKTDNSNIELDDVARTIVEDCELGGRNSGVSRKVKKAEKKTRADSTYYEIELKAGDSFEKGELVDIGWPDGETEVFNIAMVQKGGPSPSKTPSREGAEEPVTDPNREVIIYKEYVSSIDYSRDENKPWSGRRIEIHGDDNVRVLPTEGSVDKFSKGYNEPGKQLEYTDKNKKKHKYQISEFSKSGLGGGSVFTIDGVTFGLEVCLDHAYHRLKNYYDYHANNGDPKVQIHLIPSWGMTITGGKICCVDKGFVFNVDGSRSDSEVRIMKDHKEYCCTECNFIQSKPGVCLKCKTSLCKTCDELKPPQKTCTCGTALSKVYHCPEHRTLSLSQVDCPVCHRKKVLYEFKLQPIGTLVKSKGTVEVTHPGISEYFENNGQIKVYEKKSIPKAQTV